MKKTFTKPYFDKNALVTNYLKILKVVVGTCMAMGVANLFSLQFAPSAGIITLLSIQDTKKDTIKIAIHRFLSFFLAMLVAKVCFEWLGFGVVGFGGFLLVFVGLSYLFHITDGISMNAVLTTHFLSMEVVSGATVLNEFGLFTIGVIVGVVINWFMPKETEYIKEQVAMIEKEMKDIFLRISKLLEQGEEVPRNESVQTMQKVFFSLEQRLASSLSIAEKNMKNELFYDASYYMRYLNMRKSQVVILKRIYLEIMTLTYKTSQSEQIEDFFVELSRSFHEHNNVKDLLVKLEYMFAYYEKEKLPKSRKEFEHRAVLYMCLKELQAFLEIKRDFVEGLSEDMIARYWSTL